MYLTLCNNGLQSLISTTADYPAFPFETPSTYQNISKFCPLGIIEGDRTNWDYFQSAHWYLPHNQLLVSAPIG